MTLKAGEIHVKQSPTSQSETIGLPQKHGRSVVLHRLWEQLAARDVLASRDLRFKYLRVWKGVISITLRLLLQ
jgi:hypothetical protein